MKEIMKIGPVSKCFHLKLEKIKLRLVQIVEVFCYLILFLSFCLIKFIFIYFTFYKAPIKNLKRYGRSIKKRILDTQNKKFLIKYDLHLKYQRDVLEKNIRKMENDRPKLLVIFRNNRIYSTNNSKKDKDKNFVEPNKIVPEVVMSEQFYQIEKYNSIPESHAKSWKSHVRGLLNSYQQLVLIISDTKNPPYKKAFE